MYLERWLARGVDLTVALLLLAACSTPGMGSPSQLGTPEPEVESTSPPDAPEPEAWDLVFISDSSGFGVADLYAAHIEEDLGVTVTVHDLAIGALSAHSVLAALRSEGTIYNLSLKELPDLIIPEAEVVVFYANPLVAGGALPGDWDCVGLGPRLYVNDCSPEVFEAYRADLDAIYQEIIDLRAGKPTIIRAFDAYNPLYSVYRERGVYDACTACWANYNDAIHQAAEAHNILLAPVYDTFNGPNHDEDPRDKGYIGPDGEHCTELGQQVIADLLRGLGYEYTIP